MLTDIALMSHIRHGTMYTFSDGINTSLTQCHLLTAHDVVNPKSTASPIPLRQWSRRSCAGRMTVVPGHLVSARTAGFVTIVCGSFSSRPNMQPSGSEASRVSRTLHHTAASSSAALQNRSRQRCRIARGSAAAARKLLSAAGETLCQADIARPPR